nr:FAR1 DNA binding domain, zinc finger, SWIM-type, MULE transposase domain, FHY3/FAR1 family [Tanacetum cinerariifolium]
MHKAFPLPGESFHWQYKFPLPVEGVPTARRMEIPLPGDILIEDSEIAVLKSKLEKISKEKNDIEKKIKKFKNVSQSLDKLIGSQITNKIADDVEIVRVKDHVGFYVCGKDGTRTWYLDNMAGFDVRRGGGYKIVGFVDTTMKFSDVKKKQTRKKGTFRCGCLATLTIKKKGNVFEVTSLIEGHNHPIVAEKDMNFMKSSMNMGYTKHHFLYHVSNANFGPDIDFRVMKQMHGGFDRVRITVHDCKNQKKKITVFIGDREAQMAVEKLLGRKFHSPGFYVGPTLCNRTNFKRLICDIVWTDQISLEVFKREWGCMIKQFDLGENKWLDDMFSARESWIPAYLWDVRMAGLMRTTSRSEKHIIVAGAENRPPMIEKPMYDSGASRIRLFIKGKKHGSIMFDSIDNGPLVFQLLKKIGKLDLRNTLNSLKHYNFKMTVMVKHYMSTTGDSLS